MPEMSVWGRPRELASLVMRTLSSAIHLVDAGMAIAGEIPDNPFEHQVNIDPQIL